VNSQATDPKLIEALSAPAAWKPPQPGRSDFRCGERVSREDRYMQPRLGIVTRIDKQTATIDTGDGKSWRVSFQLSRHVLDI
jgi:hypothetical protein